jgi:hypothetical protein
MVASALSWAIADHHTSGCRAGSGIGLVYFSGFTGIWLAFALLFQDRPGESPLCSDPAVTPFAHGQGPPP